MRAVLYLQGLFQPQDDWPLQSLEQFKRQQQIQALWIGVMAFLLPVFLYFGNRGTDCFRDSISHSYYLPFWGNVFVAITFSIGVLLLFYRGQSRSERKLVIVSALCAFVVALNPTNGSGCDEIFSQSRVLFETHDDVLLRSAFPIGMVAGKVHLAGAVLLFVCLAIFNLLVFTALDTTTKSSKKKANRNKVIRNRIYKFCGYMMLLTIVTLAIGFSTNLDDCEAFNASQGITQAIAECDPSTWDRYNLTFYFEWLGLALFGAAWFVKGRGGGFLLTDEHPDKVICKPWWW